MSKRLLRVLLLVCELLLLYLLDNTPVPLPVRPLLLVAAALSLTGADVAVATVCGAVCGFLTDVGGGTAYFAVALTLLCFAQSTLLHTVFRNRLLSLWLLSCGAAAVLLGLSVLLRLLTGEGLSWRVPLRAALTLLCVLPLSALHRGRRHETI